MKNTGTELNTRVMRLVHKLKKYKKRGEKRNNQEKNQKTPTVSLLFSEGPVWCDGLCRDSLLCPLPFSKPRMLTGRPRLVAFALLMAKRPLELCASTLASNCSIPATDQEDFPLSKGRRTWENILWLQVLKRFHWKGSPSKKKEKLQLLWDFFFH